MKTAQGNSRRLIVEGEDDKFAVVGLMEHHINWPDGQKNAPVEIKAGGGVEKILDTNYLGVELKAADWDVLGFLIDSDFTGVQSRYDRLRGACAAKFPSMPEQLPARGLIVPNDAEKRLGVWIMPDNLSNGSLETFLSYLAPTDGLWSHAKTSTDSALTQGASCHQAHLDKAYLYTWLSWQEPPGQSPGRALTQKILNPHSKSAKSFVCWFRTLYGL